MGLAITYPPATPAPAIHIAVVGTIFSFVWSSAFIAGKVGMTSTGPLTLLSLRFLLAGLLLAQTV
jgi:drug/metabolite transporter (DMT)-like permease